MKAKFLALIVLSAISMSAVMADECPLETQSRQTIKTRVVQKNSSTHKKIEEMGESWNV